MKTKSVKIYTKKGDYGETSLAGGEHVLKNDPKVEAYGTVDELNAFLGVLKAELERKPYEKILTDLEGIQRDLFLIAALLAGSPCDTSTTDKEKIEQYQTQSLERAIDDMQSALEPLNAFILPGGHSTAAFAHVCRTVCRRAERRVVELISPDDKTLTRSDHFDPVIKYLNRLSDYFFVLARYCNAIHQHPDVIWKQLKQQTT